jgi:hypothetical protein
MTQRCRPSFSVDSIPLRAIRCVILRRRHATPTFSNTLALMRGRLWRNLDTEGFVTSTRTPHMRKPEREMLARFSELLCYAA